MPVAVVTGASAGFGRALARSLAEAGWDLVLDARDAAALGAAARLMTGAASVHIEPGDVTDPAHRRALRAAVESRGHLDLLVNNASWLGPSPQPRLRDYPIGDLQRVYTVDVIAPIALTAALLPALEPARGTVVNISSDAAAEAYAGWGGYGGAKAALDHATAVFAQEEAAVHFYSFDPGDMQTAMHQAAFPGADISDRPAPESVVPALQRLLRERPPSGRYRATELSAVAGSGR